MILQAHLPLRIRVQAHVPLDKTVNGGSVRPPLYLRDPARIFGSEPNFHEVSRQISTKAIEAAARHETH